MIHNRQSKLRINLQEVRAMVRRLQKELQLGNRRFDVAFVDDNRIRALNAAYRRKPQPTDVLSFPWTADHGSSRDKHDLARDPSGEFRGFLGDVVISVDTARRNARAEGHAPGIEINWLILHGVLHLMGMDHETDNGEMAALEQDLRARLHLNGRSAASLQRRKSAPSVHSRRKRTATADGEIREITEPAPVSMKRRAGRSIPAKSHC